MKVLMINGSPHSAGTTATALKVVADQLERAGIDTETVQAGGRMVRGCIACNACRQSGRCVFEEDPVNACLEKVRSCQGLLIGAPVYYSGIAGDMKCFLDRFFYAGADLRFKVGGAVACLRRSGGVDTYHQLVNYFNLAQIVLAPTPYWPVVHGNNGQELLQDLEGLQILRTLGRNMAWLMHSLAKAALPPPEAEQKVATNFIR